MFLFKSLKDDINLIENFKNNGKILDIGAGRGDLLFNFNNSWEKWAYDPYLSNKEIVLLKHKIGTHVNDYMTLDKYPIKYFDVLVLRNVIEHTKYFDELIKTSSKLLRKGGYIFIRTPNTNSIDFKIFKNEWWVVNMSGHISFFSPDSIDLLLTKHGLTKDIIIPDRYSSPLSLYRSKSKSPGKIRKIIVSALFSLLSPHLGEGGDMVAVYHTIS